MELAEKLKEILGVIESTEIVYLSTIDENGYPSTRAMLNLRNKKQYPHLIPMYGKESNEFTIYLTTNTSSAKIKEIENNSKAAVYFCNPESFMGTMLQGKIEIVTSKEFKHHGFAKGIDLFYRDKSTIPNGDFWAGYSYLDSKRYYRDYPTSATPKYFSKHNFTFVYKQWISRIKSNVGLTYHYLSGRPFYNPNKSDDNFMTDKTKSYTDLSANYALDLSNFIKLPVTFFFSATNILGENHIYGYNYSTTPDSNNQYTLYPVKSLAKRFYTVAILFSFK